MRRFVHFMINGFTSSEGGTRGEKSVLLGFRDVARVAVAFFRRFARRHDRRTANGSLRAAGNEESDVRWTGAPSMETEGNLNVQDMKVERTYLWD